MDSRGAGGERAGPFAPDAVVEGPILGSPARPFRNRRGGTDDDVGAPGDADERVDVEQVAVARLAAKLADPLRVLRTPREADHFVPVRGQVPDEPPAEDARRAADENLHFAFTSGRNRV